MPHARARQRLHQMSADAADAEDRHARALQALHTGFAEDQLRSHESFIRHLWIRYVPFLQ